ncbi:hypothetical protein K4F52_002627 [Lecanicillium sp. MT-2017a]|nr:hypothetical protein K4F52_002627 [Lecanicillium sp. MT-2017a]
MATIPINHAAAGTNYFDIYNDNAGPGAGRDPANLPHGGCNYVDMIPGTAGTRCGCRRFWTRPSHGSPTSNQQGWCMCNHHACFHDERGPDANTNGNTNGHVHAQAPPVNVAGQENERPKTGREPLSPVIDMAFKVPPAVPGLDMPSFSVASLSFLNKPIEDTDMTNAPPPLPKPSDTPHAAPSLPDTMSWGDYVQSEPDHGQPPPVPPQCFMSQTPSTTSSAQAKYLKPFAGTGLHTLGGPKPRSPAKPPTSRPRHQLAIHEEQTTAPNTEQAPGSPMTTITTEAEPRALEKDAVSREMVKNLTDTVSGHEQRLDKLETGSFAAGATHDDCADKHEHFDLRITELEGKVDEMEKGYNDNETVASRRGDRNDEVTTTGSVISVATSTTSRPLQSHELLAQVQALQSQVSQLQASLPSLTSPWEVEMVFLPFPLKRVWQDIRQFKVEPAISNDDWTQLPMTNSTSTLRSQSPLFGDWTTSDHDAEWLLPKACGDKSVTDRRLRSRGLIKTVSVKGPDARSVQTAVNAAFGSIFKEMQILPRRQDADPRNAKFMGLQSSWIPLRKIHRDSRLRFLSPAEMATPALWDVQFLNSVMMRSSEPRLFVTHPDAYLQDYFAFEAGWTWQRVRELTRVYPDYSESQQVPEADAMEEHWSWNEHLDEPPSVNTSMNLRKQKQRVSMSPSFARLPLIERWRSQSPAVVRENSPMMRSRAGSRPPHIRTASVPAVAAARPSPMEYQRRVSSYSYYSRRPSPAIRAVGQSGIMKSRRTRSPSHPRFTPRWTNSPSPMPWGPNDRAPMRGMTPFAYATPYSNAPIQEVRGVRSGSVVRFDAQHQYYDHQGPIAPENDEDIEIYESDSDYEDDSGSVRMVVPDAQPDPRHVPEGYPMSEDEPWPGIEDQVQRPDTENIDPRAGAGGDEHGDNHSSQPSEYPSTQIIKRDEDEEDDFRIHEDL